MVVRNCVIVQLQIRDDTYNDVYFNKLSFVIATNFTNEIISFPIINTILMKILFTRQQLYSNNIV